MAWTLSRMQCGVLMGVLLAIGGVAAAQEKAADVYMVALGSGDAVLSEDANLLVAMGEDIGGRVVMRINGNPVGFLSTGGLLIEVNQYLRPGENELTLEGESKKPVHVKIGRMRDHKLEQVVGKRSFSPTDLLAGTSGAKAMPKAALVFKAEVSENPLLMGGGSGEATPRASPKASLSERAREELAAGQVGKIHAAMKAGKTKEAVGLLLQGRELWQVKMYGQSQAELADLRESMAQGLGAIGPRVRPLESAGLKFIHGPQVTLVYAGFAEQAGQGGYLLTAETDDGVVSMPPLRIAFIKGQALVWE